MFALAWSLIVDARRGSRPQWTTPEPCSSGINVVNVAEVVAIVTLLYLLLYLFMFLLLLLLMLALFSYQQCQHPRSTFWPASLLGGTSRTSHQVTCVATAHEGRMRRGVCV